MQTIKHISGLLLTGVLALGAVSSAEAAWPKDQPITMVVAYAPGGATDVAARLAAVYIEKHLGQSIVVLNKPGAGGEIGFNTLAEAKPDGYTVGFINAPNVLTIPIQRKTRYELESFIPVAQLMDDPLAYLALIDSPINTLNDLIKYAKDNPGKVTLGTTGIGSDDHIGSELFSKASGIKMRHVPFDSGGAARTALFGKHVMLGVFNISEAKEFVTGGQIKILGQMATARTELFPDVPTFREQGYNIVMSARRGIAMPAGTPQDIVIKFADAVEKAVKDPEFKKKCEEANIPLSYLSPDDFLKALQGDRSDFKKLWDADPWIAPKK
jgi:tripartite-type tricarboxylate transporter receptor subunit TctC